MSEVLIKVENVSKKFCKDLKRSLWYGMTDIARSVMGGAPTENLREGEFWAVRDVSFEVRRGECLGLIGHNGAGKSTLLKMLNGLINPDEGRIEMHGKIGALIELGAGFNPILTGRENVYNNGAVLGFSKAEIDRKFDDIVAFAEIEDFIDMPVQNYSSGMKVRLGFAIASQMEPDILLVDEVLAVGDVGFRIKCYNEIYRMMEKSAVIFVTHSMPQLAKVCTRGILLGHGSILSQSVNVGLVINEYLKLFKTAGLQIEGSAKGKFQSIRVFNEFFDFEIYNSVKIKSSETIEIDYNSTTFFELNLTFAEPLGNYLLLLSFEDMDQKIVAHLAQGPLQKTITNINFGMSLENFNSGKYSISFHLFDMNNNERGEILYGFRNLFNFSIIKPIFFGPAPIELQKIN